MDFLLILQFLFFQLSRISVVCRRCSKDKLRGTVTSFMDDPGGKTSGSSGCLSDIPRNVLVFLKRSWAHRQICSQFHQPCTRAFFGRIFQQSQNVTRKTTFVQKICTYNVDEIDTWNQFILCAKSTNLGRFTIKKKNRFKF